MKISKLIINTILGIFVCAVVGCSSELSQNAASFVPEADAGFMVTATAGMPQGNPNTRLSFDDASNPAKLLVTWKNTGESFSVLKAAEGGPATFVQTGINMQDPHQATFEGMISDKEGDSYAFYPALDESVQSAAATDLTLDMEGQSGDVLDESKVYMYGKNNGDASHSLNFNFAHLTSIVKVTLQLPAEAKGNTINGVTFFAGGLKTQVHADITQTPPAYSNEITGSLTLSGSFTLSSDAIPQATVYLHVLPSTLVDFRVSAVVGGNLYTGIVSASCIIKEGMMYTATVSMSKPSFTVNTTVASGTSNYYDGLEMQVGSWDSETSASQVTLGSATIIDGKAVITADLSSYIGKAIWVCIPKVAKFFHVLTAGEVYNTLTLPDKDGGSTILKDENYKAGNVYYKNDWIVALYMGIDYPVGTPVYWATGNLIATKTNMENDGSTNAVFHIATAEETAAESCVDSPYNVPEGINIETGGNDGYITCAVGSQWNMFGFGDITGLKVSADNADYGNGANSIVGDAMYDVCRAQLKGSWRLPYYNESYDMSKKLYRSEWNATGNRFYAYIYRSGEIINTITFPASGYRDERGEHHVNSYYWSGTPDDTSTNVNRACSIGLNESAVGFSRCGFHNGCAVRPISE
ncbi:hypothetical protein AAE250_22400 [Bacteroides sp. GD17]|jgi:hypothetical protein|uniref:hypothetical protein n=1 Tax=Bacteroides sp. GD17 TaxID=3139826 RepID=UPI0025D99E31|nr:hypothetical protein [uncultured Bacteroides sp.]